MSGSVLFVAPDGHTVGAAQHFCHRTAVVAPPDPAAVMVTVDAVAECGDRGTVATTGTVVAFFV